MKLVWWQSLPLLACGAYVVFCLSVALHQKRLLYFPETLTEAQADLTFKLYHVARWPEGSGASYRGLLKRTAPECALTNGTALVFHGNAGGAHEREYYADTLQKLGWRVVLAEYPGYGARSGERGEAAFRQDGRETAKLLRKQFPGRLAIIGESLGASVAAAVSADPEVRPDALILATPWDRLATVASHHYPWLPVRLVLRDPYDSVEYLRAYEGPVTVLMAGDDEIMPAASTQALFDALPSAAHKRLVRVPDCGHNEWFWQVSEEQWREALSPR
jgi:pimeloyl-ACP methyl ester carboxylesterase